MDSNRPRGHHHHAERRVRHSPARRDEEKHRLRRRKGSESPERAGPSKRHDAGKEGRWRMDERQEGGDRRRQRSKSPTREGRPFRSPKRERWSPDHHHGNNESSHRGSRSHASEAPCYKPSEKLKEEEPLLKWGPPSLAIKEEEGKLQESKPKEKPSFEPSGKLTEETNTYRGVVIKYNEPPEAQRPKTRWRLYPFKGEEQLPVIYIHRQSAYLIGRERKIADLPIDHPSCSKQHAVIQYRSVPYEREDGSRGRRIRPYIIDLSSGNGTYLNGVRVEAQRYIELKEKDVLKFGFSTREYVVLSENSAEEGGNSDMSDGEPDVDMTGVEERRIKEEANAMFL